MISAAELTAMQDTQTDALPDDCTIRRTDTAADGAGGIADDATPTDVDTICRVGEASGMEVEAAAKITNKRPVTLTFAFDEDVLTTDTVIVGTRTFQLLSVDSGSWNTALRAVAVEA